MTLRSDEYFRGVDEITERLDKIIELLNNMPSYQFPNAEVAVKFLQIMRADDQVHPLCTCGQYGNGKGQLTGGFWCPVHGQQF